MIKTEYVLTRADGVEIHRHYSDDNRYIIQKETGAIYISAEDITPCPYTYEEGDYTQAYKEELAKQIDEQYPDDRIEKSISCNTLTTTTTTTGTMETATDLNSVDSGIIS